MIFTYKCNSCGNEFPVKLLKAETTIPCPKCSKESSRLFKSVEVGEVVSDSLINAANTMLYGKLPSGKDKIVF